MNNNASLVDRVIIVTGGTGRLGQAVTKKLLGLGAQVVATYTNPTELEKLQKQLSAEEMQKFVSEKVDVTNEKEVATFITGVINKFQRIDGLANLVGGWQSKPITELSLEDWQKQLNLNLTSAFLMNKAVLPHMISAKYGRILGVGVQSAIQAKKEQANYNVSKVGVMWLMETISHEVRQHGITANSILPSAIKTVAEHDADPDGLWVQPEEVAELVAYLMSPASSATSGAKIPVYGKV